MWNTVKLSFKKYFSTSVGPVLTHERTICWCTLPGTLTLVFPAYRSSTFENFAHAELYKGTTRIPSLGAARVPLMRSSKFKLCCVLETNTKKSRYSGRLYVLLLRHNIVFRRRSFSNQKSDLAAGFSHNLCEMRSSCHSKSTFPLLLDLYFFIFWLYTTIWLVYYSLPPGGSELIRPLLVTFRC